MTLFSFVIAEFLWFSAQLPLLPFSCLIEAFDTVVELLPGSGIIKLHVASISAISNMEFKTAK